jgi:uncharacterized protein (DUF849 family)
MLPITAQEIVETARRCEEAGAMAIHVHVRDAAGSHSICPVRYGDVTKKIAEATTLRIQVSTEAAGIFDVPAQYEMSEPVGGYGGQRFVAGDIPLA